MLTYNQDDKMFIWSGHMDPAITAGFKWSDGRKCWFAKSKYVAFRLRKFAEHPEMFKDMEELAESSYIKTPIVGYGTGLYPFQDASVECLVDRFRKGRRHLLLADDCGLGKTPQALQFAREIGAERILVICPASVRINWLREIFKWHDHPAQAYIKGNQKLIKGWSVVTSYSLVKHFKGRKWDLVIVDECHNIKNIKAQKTYRILGRGRYKGIVDLSPTLFLSGTPEPNGKPNELYPLLSRCASDVIDGMSYWDFINRFCTYYTNDAIPDPVITGAKNRTEFYTRLRASGFMVRRQKQEVLKDLPPLQHKMILFPKNSKTAKIIKQEQEFDLVQISKGGGDDVPGLPELRREMAIEKVPQCLEYVKGMLNDGVEKVVLFCHHIEVIELLTEGLKSYGVVNIYGGVSGSNRQRAVDRFQNSKDIRVFIGNEAAEEGITLTASSDVVLVEVEWVPSKNVQRGARAHRIGQASSVTIHYLMVEGSLDAKILGVATQKADDIKKTLDEG